ncbi:MAG: RnfABCDGE type electron transport complex subunit G [Lentimicrobiaceae bacterium]|nr:RnfABCDGE type electron transport complex subunit G [Lentimicrobiaceae bacterium]
MTKIENPLLKLVVALTCISVVSAVVLSVVYMATKEPIAAIKVEKKRAAKILVLPGFDANTGELIEKKIWVEGLRDSLTVTLAYMNNELFGAAVATHTNMAFSGRFDIMVGFDKEGNILNTEVLSHQETPGLGDKIDKRKDKFPLQFVGKNPDRNNLAVRKDGGEIDAITAATITSRAFSDAVNNAWKAYQIVLENYELETVNETSKGELITGKEESYE